MLEIATHLLAARRQRGLSQAELAERSRLKRQQITFFERGVRTPSVAQLLRMAGALDVSLQWLLHGEQRGGGGIRDTAIELRALGLADLWVKDPVVPGAFRRPEEAIVLALSEQRPSARIVEAIPAPLAWNRWNDLLLWAFAREKGRAAVYRLAWLAEIALHLEETGGFPGGCPGKDDLVSFLKRAKAPPEGRRDDLGHPAGERNESPIWKRWGIRYAGDLNTFRKRAQELASLTSAEGWRRQPRRAQSHGT